MNEYDALIIGCGPAGAEAAQALLAAGKFVAIVEKGEPGGTCLNQGCIPSKMLLCAIELGLMLRPLAKRRLASGEERINYPALQKRIRIYIDAARSALKQGLQTAGATLLEGTASFCSPDTVEVATPDQSIKLKAKEIIIATGSMPTSLPGMSPNHETILDSTDLMFIKEPPASLLIVGAGAIGLELASFFAYLGTKIIIIENGLHIAPGEDADLAQFLQAALGGAGYEIHTGRAAVKLEASRNKAMVELANGETLEAERALLAIGRHANIARLNLDAAGCRTDSRGFIQTDEFLLAAPHIYAIGDVNGRTLLAHAASQQARYIARRILAKTARPYSPGVIPSLIDTQPGIFRAGLNEREASLREGQIEISKSQLAANPIAQARCEPGGFIKAIWLNGQLAGLAGAGRQVTELVTAAELLVAGNYSGDKLDALMLAHPTLAESLGQTIRAKREVLKE